MDQLHPNASESENTMHPEGELGTPHSQNATINGQSQSSLFGSLPFEVRNIIYSHMPIHHHDHVDHEWLGYVSTCQQAYQDIEEVKRHAFRLYMQNWDAWKDIVDRSAEFGGTIDFEVKTVNYLSDGDGSLSRIPARTLNIHMNHPFRVVEELISELAILQLPKVIIHNRKDDTNPLPVWQSTQYRDLRLWQHLRAVVANTITRTGSPQRRRGCALPRNIFQNSVPFPHGTQVPSIRGSAVHCLPRGTRRDRRDARTRNVYFLMDGCGVSDSPDRRFTIEKYTQHWGREVLIPEYQVRRATDSLEQLA